MDFFIEDKAEKLEDNKVGADDNILRDYLTFVDFDIFSREYLKSIEYNDPVLRGMGQISLQLPVFEKKNDYPKL